MAERRWLPKAVLSPAAAYFVNQRLGAELRAVGREKSARQGQEWLGRELLEAAEEVERIGAAWFESMKVDPGAEPVVPVGRELTSGQAAKVLQLGVRQVTKLAGRAIDGRQVGRRWLLEEASVLAYRDRASSEQRGSRNSA